MRQSHLESQHPLAILHNYSSYLGRQHSCPLSFARNKIKLTRIYAISGGMLGGPLRRRSGRRGFSFRLCFDGRQRALAQAERPPGLTMPKAPADVFDRFGAGAVQAAACRGVRPAAGALSGMLDAYRDVKPVKYMTDGSGARGLPSDRGPSAPSLRIVTSVSEVMPRPVSTPFNRVCCWSASPGTPLNRTGFLSHHC